MWGEKRSSEQSENPKGKGKGSRPSSLLSTTEFRRKRDPDRTNVFQERKTSQNASFFNKGDCPKENACDYWHPRELDNTQAEDTQGSINNIGNGGLLHGESAIPVKSGRILLRSPDWLAPQNDLRKSARRKVQPWQLHNKVDKAVELRTPRRTSN